MYIINEECKFNYVTNSPTKLYNSASLISDLFLNRYELQLMASIGRDPSEL